MAPSDPPDPSGTNLWNVGNVDSFKTAIGRVSEAIDTLAGRFHTMADKASADVSRVNAQIDSLIQKATSAQAAVSGLGGGGGGGNVADTISASSPIGGTSKGSLRPSGMGSVMSQRANFGGAGYYSGTSLDAQLALDPRVRDQMPSGGMMGYGLSSQRLALGAGVATAGALGRAGNKLADQGIMQNQLSFFLQSARGGSLQSNWDFAKHFQGWGAQGSSSANLADLMGALQANTVGNYGPTTPLWTQRAAQSGALATVGQAAGIDTSMTGMVNTNKFMNTMAGRQALANIGITPPAQGDSLAAVVEQLSKRAGNGRYASARVMSDFAGPGSATWQGLMGATNNDEAAVKSALVYAQRLAAHPGVTPLSQDQTPQQSAATLKALGIQDFATRRMNAAEQTVRATAGAATSAADVNTSIKNTEMNTLATAANTAGIKQLLSGLGGAAGGMSTVTGPLNGALGAAGSIAQLLMLRKMGGGAGADAIAAASGGRLSRLGGRLGTLRGGLGLAGATVGADIATQGIRQGNRSIASRAETIGGAALTGAAIGSFFPGAGTLIGGIGGAIVGSGIAIGQELSGGGTPPVGAQGGGTGSSTSGNAGGATTPASAPAPSPSPGSGGAAIVNDAKKYLGVPYKWGGSDPKTGLDCSGLTQLVMKDVGISIDHFAADQAKTGTPVPNLQAAQPGDLVFYGGSGYDGTPSAPGHVGIYVGNGQMIDAPHSGTVVRYDNVGNPVAIRRESGGSIGNSGSSSTVSSTPGNTTSAGLAGAGEGNAGQNEAGIIAGSLFPTMAASHSSTVTNSSGSGVATSTASGGSVVAGSPGSTSGNQALGQRLAAAMGWSGAEWVALNNLEMREAGWNNTAKNPSSGAYGIAQALGHGPTNQYPAGQYAAANPPPLGTSDAGTQISWMLQYIKGTYGDPLKAWAHEQSAGWYEGGSQYIDRDQLAQLHRGEMVIRAGAAAAMRMNQLSSSSGRTIIVAEGALNYNAAASAGGANVSSGPEQDAQQMAKMLWAEIKRQESLDRVAAD